MIVRPFLALALGAIPASALPPSGAAQQSCAQLRMLASAAQSPDGLAKLGYSAPRPMFGFRECSADEQLMGGMAFSCLEDFRDARRQWQSLVETVHTCLPNAVRQPDPAWLQNGRFAEFRAGAVSITIHLGGYANRREHYVSFVLTNADVPTEPVQGS